MDTTNIYKSWIERQTRHVLSNVTLKKNRLTVGSKPIVAGAETLQQVQYAVDPRTNAAMQEVLEETGSVSCMLQYAYKLNKDKILIYDDEDDPVMRRVDELMMQPDGAFLTKIDKLTRGLHIRMLLYEEKYAFMMKEGLLTHDSFYLPTQRLIDFFFVLCGLRSDFEPRLDREAILNISQWMVNDNRCVKQYVTEEHAYQLEWDYYDFTPDDDRGSNVGGYEADDEDFFLYEGLADMFEEKPEQYEGLADMFQEIMLQGKGVPIDDIEDLCLDEDEKVYRRRKIHRQLMDKEIYSADMQKTFNNVMHVFLHGFLKKHALLFKRVVVEEHAEVVYNEVLRKHVPGSWRNQVGFFFGSRTCLRAASTTIALEKQGPGGDILETWTNLTRFMRNLSRTNKVIEGLADLTDLLFNFDTFAALLALSDLIHLSMVDTSDAMYSLWMSAVLRLCMTSFWKRVIFKFPIFATVIEVEVKQGIEDVNILDSFKEMMKSPLADKIGLIVSSFFASSFFKDLDMAKRFALTSIRDRGVDLKTSVNVVVSVLDLFNFMCERISAFVKTGNPLDLFGRNPVVSSCDLCDVYIDKLEAADRNRLSKQNFKEYAEIVVFRDKLHGDSKKDNFKGDIRFGDCFRRLLDALHNYKNSYASAKVSPMGFILYGDSGSGKTFFVKELVEALKFRKEIPSDVDVIVRYSPGDKFSVVPPAACAVVCDDKISRKDEDMEVPIIDMLQGFIEKEPYKFNCAALNDKAKSSVNIDLVAFSTNVECFVSALTAGNDKCDRRYTNVCVKYTQELLDYCNQRSGIEPNRYLKMMMDGDLPDQGVANPFRYTIGYMNNSEAQQNKKGVNAQFEVKFTIKHALFETYILEEALAFCNNLVIKENSTADMIKPLLFRCAHGLPLEEGGVCECLVARTQPVLRSKRMVMQGASSSRGVDVHLGYTGELEEEEEVMTYYPAFDERGDALSDKLGEDWKKFTLLRVTRDLIAIATFGVMIGGFVNLFRTVASASSVDQAVVSGTVRDVKSESGYVVPCRRRLPAYAVGRGDARLEYTVRVALIRKGIAYRMHGNFLTPEILTIPMHLFQLPMDSGNQFEDGLTLEIERFGSVFKFITDSSCYYEDSFRDDRCFYFCHNFPMKPYGCYSELTDSPGPFKGTFCGTDVTFHRREDKLLEMRGYITMNGQCGLPYVSEEGDFLGSHVAIIGGVHPVGVRLNKQIADVVIRHYESKGLVTLVNVRPLGPVIQGLVERLKPVSAPGDTYHYQKLFDLQTSISMDMDIKGKLNSPNYQKMTGRKTELYPFFSELLGKNYVQPHVGHALELAGYNSPVTTRLNRKVEPILMKLHRDAVAIWVDMIPQPGRKLEPLTYHDALAGSMESTAVNGIKDDTSVGPYFKCMGIDKKALIRKEDEEWVFHPEFHKRYDEIMQAIRAGENIPHIVSANLKDEMISEEKYKAGGGRFFYACGKAENVALRQYLIPIMNWLSDNWKSTGKMANMNPGSNDWAQMESKIRATGSKLYDGDFRWFDMSHTTMMTLYEFAMFCVALHIGYSYEDAVIVMRLIHLHSMYFLEMEGFVFLCNIILNSGRSDTIEVNDVINQILAISWVLYEAHGNRYIDLYDRYVESHTAECGPPDVKLWPQVDFVNEYFMPVVGDDNKLVLADRLTKLDRFKIERYVFFLKMIGYSYTPSNKRLDIPMDWKSIDDPSVTFLKRSSVVYEGRVFGALAVDSIAKSLCFVVGLKIPEKERNLAAWLCAEKEAFLHGPVFYEKLQEMALKANLPVRPFKFHLNMFDRGMLTIWEPHSPEMCVDEGKILSFPYQGSDLSVLPPYLKDMVTMFGKGTDITIELQAKVDRLGGQSTVLKSPTEINMSKPTSETSAPPVLADAVQICTQECQVEGGSSRTPTMLLEPTREDRTIFSIPRKIATVNAALASTTIVPVACWTLYNGLNPLAPYTRNYMMWRGTPEVEIAFSGSSALVGLIRFFAMPNREVDPTNYGLRAAALQDSVPSNLIYSKSAGYRHVDIDVSAASNHKLQLYFPFAEDYVSQGVNDFLIVMMPISPIVSVYGITSATPSFDIYVSYPNLRLYQMVPQGVEDNPGVISSGLRFAQSIFSRVPYMNSFTEIAKQGANFAQRMGYSRLPEGPSTQMVSRTIGDFSSMSGVSDMAYHLNTDMRALHNMEDSHLPGQPINELTDLTRRWGHIAQNLAVNSAVYISPGTTQNNGSSWYLTPLATVAFMYAYWRGDLELDFVFTSSPLIRTRIGINVYAPGTTVQPNFVSNGSIIAHVVEVAGSTNYKVLVPYLYNRKFAPVVGPNVADTTGCVVTYFILDGPYGPSTTVPAPYVNLFMRAAPNLEFAVPTTAIINKFYQVQGAIDVGGATFGERIDSLCQLAKRTVLTYEANNETATQFTGLGNANYFFLPEEGFTPQFNLTGAGTVYGPNVNSHVSVANIGWSFHTWIRQSVLGYSGGNIHRLYLLPVASTTFDVVPSDLPFYILTELEYIGTAATQSAPGPAQTGLVSRGRGMQMFKGGIAEVVIPDYSMGEYKVNQIGQPDNTTAVRCIVVKMDGIVSGATLGVQIGVSTSAADDVRYGEFMPMTLGLLH